MYDRAMDQVRQGLDLDGSMWHLHWVRAQTYLLQGEPDKALASVETAFQLAPWESRVLALLAGLLSRAGQEDRAAGLIAQLEDGGAVGLASCRLLRGEIDAAGVAYEKAIERREPTAAMYYRSPLMKPLRDSARWHHLRQRMKLPDVPLL
jgi:tetratricopeptide (TPR) repeat protein